MYSDRVYELFALWEKAKEDGSPFCLAEQAEPEVRREVEVLIEQLHRQPEQPDDESVPQQTTRYRFVEFIARGGMGDVWRGIDKQLDRTVALKVLRRRWGISERTFWGEAKLVAKLTHPGIAAVYDIDQLSDGRPFFAMKFVEGENFEQWLQSRSSDQHSSTEWLRVFRQICQTVAYAHGQSPPLIHRDLKPHNVMVGVYGEVFVMDWGIAKSLTTSDVEPFEFSGTHASALAMSSQETLPRVTSQGVVKGTLCYMSPEQATGELSLVGPATDVFALGGILCRILTGLPPYWGENIAGQAAAGDIAPALIRLEQSNADASLVEIAKTCLASEIPARYRDAREVLKAISDYELEQQERLRMGELAEVKRVTQQVEQKRRLAWQVAVMSLATVLVLVAAAVFWYDHARRQSAREEHNRMSTQAAGALEEAERRLNDAREQPLDKSLFDKAEDAAKRAEESAHKAQDELLSQRSAQLLTSIRDEAKNVGPNARFLTDLLEVRAFPRLDRGAASADSDANATLASTEERFQAALRRRGLHIDFANMSAEECISRLKSLPAPLLPEVATAFDKLWLVNLLTRRDPKAIQSLLITAYRLDQDGYRKQLREIVVARMIGNSLAESDLEWLRKTAERVNLAREPATGIVLLYHVLRLTENRQRATDLLLRAVNERPGEPLLISEVADLYEEEGPDSSLEKAIEFRRALRSIRPETGRSLARDLLLVGRPAEAGQVARDLILKRNEPEDFVTLGICLSLQSGRVRSEKWAYQEALRLKPGYPYASRQLELLLGANKRQPDEQHRDVTAEREKKGPE